MNLRLAVAAATALTASLALAPAASAYGANTGLAGVSIAHTSLDLVTFTGECTYARVAAGLGGRGVTYYLAGTGTAGGSYRGVPVVATGIRCRLHLPNGEVVTAGPEYLPGFVAETDTSHTTNDASGGTVCTVIYAILRQTPPGATTNQIASREICH